jgi:hypothetical protein
VLSAEGGRVREAPTVEVEEGDTSEVRDGGVLRDQGLGGGMLRGRG